VSNFIGARVRERKCINTEGRGGLHPLFQSTTNPVGASLLAIPKPNAAIKPATHLRPDTNRWRGDLSPLGCEAAPVLRPQTCMNRYHNAGYSPTFQITGSILPETANKKLR
jgi:hypothetical protein